MSNFETSRERPVKIDFTNTSIHRAIRNIQKNNSNSKETIDISFKHSPGSLLKGLVIRVYKKTGSATFTLRGSFNKIEFRHNLGEFSKINDCKAVEEKIIKLLQTIKKHKTWIQNPSVKTKVLKESITVNQVIEMCADIQFPRKIQEGYLSHFSIRDHSRYLFGYNDRLEHFNVVDNRGDGKIVFKHSSKYQSFKDLFKAYPPGVGVRKSGETSVYDSWLGQELIKDLLPGHIENYLNSTIRSYGQKLNILKSLSYCWGIARYKLNCLGFNPPLDPTRREYGGIKLVRTAQSKSKTSLYNDKTFSDAELKAIKSAYIKLARRFPFQSECIMMMMFTGWRKPEVQKLTWSMITEEDQERIIRLPKEILKGRNNYRQQDIIKTLDSNIEWVLNRVKRQLKRKKFQRLYFQIQRGTIPYIFPSTRISFDRLANPEVDPGYGGTSYARVKDLVNCWNEFQKVSGVRGALKTFRKTNDDIKVDVAGSVDKAQPVLNRLSKDVTRRFYLKATKEKRRSLDKKVAEAYKIKTNLL